LGFRLVGYPFNFLVGDMQLMYGFCGDVDSLCELFSSKLGLPAKQMEAVRRTAVQGGVQEVGGSRSGAVRLFSRVALENLGMTFHLPDV
jgi:hypothetical protein